MRCGVVALELCGGRCCRGRADSFRWRGLYRRSGDTPATERNGHREVRYVIYGRGQVFPGDSGGGELGRGGRIDISTVRSSGRGTRTGDLDCVGTQ